MQATKPFILVGSDVFELSQFEQVMAHKADVNGNVESCNFFAFKIDDENGIAAALNFPSNMLSKVDYCALRGAQVSLIELTDLSNTIAAWQEHLKSTEEQNLSRKARREARRRIWDVTSKELRLKWMGSIAVIERLWRISELKEDAQYQMVLICKNDVDVKMLDQLTQMLSGCVSKLAVCRSKDVQQLLN